MPGHHPVHNSEVFLLGLAPRPSVPPPSPPSPVTPTDAGISTPIEQLCLDSATLLPNEDETSSSVSRRRLFGAIHVLNTEATALRSLTRLYRTSAAAAEGFNAAVEAIVHQGREGGKLVVTGVGKSGHIGKKLVATFNSLGLQSTFLHPTEALHGDLGKVRGCDVVMFITFSGRTAELLTLLPHIDPSLPVVVLTSHALPAACEIVRRRPGAILLPAPIHEAENVSFGVSAPTTSTTVSLALGDALAVVVSRELHPSVHSVFARNHPGGAIGAATRAPRTVRELAVPIADVPELDPCSRNLCGGDVLKAAYDSPSGWVSVGQALACPSRIRRLQTFDLGQRIGDLPELLVHKTEWFVLAADTPISQAADWVRDLLKASGHDETAGINGQDSILAIVDTGDMAIGVMEASELL